MRINEEIVTKEEDILSVLEAVESGEEEFAILDIDENNFLQTSSGELEYRNQDGLIRVVASPVEPAKIKKAFLAYYHGDDKVLKEFNWEKVEYLGFWATIKSWFGK